jgi:DNA-binding transcriptional ArsR family regulator
MDSSNTAVESQTGPAEAFSALGDPARLAILTALSGGTRCVCELVPRLGLPQNLVSYHLGILREAGFVRGSRRGRRIEYTIEAGGLRTLKRELDRLDAGSTGRAR